MASQSRLRTAIDDGLLILPDGPICVMRPPVTYDISALGRPAHIAHSLFTDSAAWSAAGYDVSQDIGEAKTVVVVTPRSKALARSMVAEACAHAELVIVDGYKTDGVDSLFKNCRKVLGDLPSVTKDHGRLFWFNASPDFADWKAPPPAIGPHGYYTTAGVFSEGSVDKGSALLAAALPAKLPTRLADFGAGWGYLTSELLKRDNIKSIDLVEAEALSLECARLNVTDPRANFIWGDATQHRAEKGYDGIIMNPPFHTSRDAQPAIGQAFIAGAAKALASHGKLWMVANRHLPYEAHLRDHFRNVDELPGNGAFKIFHATRPQR